MSQKILVPWSKDFKLTWNELIGPIEPSNQMAWTHTSLDYSYDVELIEKKTCSKFEIKNIKVTAFFQKSISWVRPEMIERHDQAEILMHEQGHLDLAELYARQFQKKIENHVQGKHFTCKGKTKKEKLEYAHSQGKQILEEIWNTLLPEWHSYESKYEKVTNHGLNHAAQKEYDKIFDKLRA